VAVGEDLIQEFDEQVLVLQNMHYEEAPARLGGFLDWLESEPLTNRILQHLLQAVNVDSLLRGFHAPNARTVEEIAAVGLRIIQTSRTRDFFHATRSLGIKPPYNTSALQDYCSDAVPRYIDPFINYLRRKLTAEASRHSVGAISEATVASLLNSEAFKRDFPATQNHLDKISREFLRPDEHVAWQNIANSCRQTLIDFCKELRSLYDFEITAETKEADVKAVLRQAIQSLGATGQFADSLEKLSAAIWSHAQSLLHRGSTTKIEAIRLYLWTGLLINELTNLLLAKLAS
jgi:hypothetical protein